MPTISEEMIPSFIVLTQGGLADYEGVDWSATEPHIAHQRKLSGEIGRLRLRARRAHAGAAQPPGGGALGPRLRRARHAHLGDPAAAWPARYSPRSTPRPEAPVLDVVASVSFTAFGNVTGLPAVSLPLHRTDADVPVGVQLTGGTVGRGHADPPVRAARAGAAVGRAPARPQRHRLEPWRSSRSPPRSPTASSRSRSTVPSG